MDYDRLGAHLVSIASVVGYLIGWLPAVATGLAIVCYAVQLYESPTMRRLWARLQGWRK